MKVTEETKFLATEILDYLRRFPERHDQDSWVGGHLDVENISRLVTTNVCNSTMCVAGTAVFLTKPFEEFKILAQDDSNDLMWEDEGQRLLGLDDSEANALFYSGNGRALALLRAIANGDADEFARIDFDTVDDDFNNDGSLVEDNLSFV